MVNHWWSWGRIFVVVSVIGSDVVDCRGFGIVLGVVVFFGLLEEDEDDGCGFVVENVASGGVVITHVDVVVDAVFSVNDGEVGVVVVELEVWAW